MDTEAVFGPRYALKTPTGGFSARANALAKNDQKLQDNSKKRNRGFINDNLNTIGGVGGGLAGLLLAPETGGLSLLIPALAAAAGQGIGEIGKESIQDSEGKVNAGEVGKQALIGGASDLAGGIAGKGINAVLGKLAGKGIAKALPAGAEVAAETAPKVEGNILQKFGGNVAADVTGIQPAAKVGKDVLGTEEAAALQSHVKDVTAQMGEKSLRPDRQLAAVETHLSDTGKQIGGAIKDADRLLTLPERKALLKEATEAVSKVPGGMANVSPEVKSILQDLPTRRNLVDQHEFAKSLDELINHTDMVTTPEKQQALKAIRGVVRGNIGNEVPELADLNKAYTMSSDAKPFLQSNLREFRKTGGLKLPFTKQPIGGVFSAGVEGKLGNLIKTAGDVGSKISSLPKAGAIIPTGAKALINNDINGNNAEAAQPTLNEPTPAEPTPQDGFSLGASQDGPDIDSMLQEALSAPDAKTQAAKLDLIGKIQAIQKNGGTTLSADEKKTQAKSAAALNNLTILEGLYKQAGGGQQRVPGAISNLLGRVGVGNTAATQSYNQVRNALVAPLARAMGETGVLTDEDRRVYARMLPDITDRPEEVQYKIQAIRDALSGMGTQQAAQ